MELSDGTVLTGANQISEKDKYSDVSKYDLSATYKGFVKHLYYKNDPANVSKKWVEADVQLIMGRQWVPVRAKIASKRGGYENFTESYPQPAKFNILNQSITDETSPDRTRIMTHPNELDVEWVTVVFIDKNFNDAWINGTLPHGENNKILANSFEESGDFTRTIQNQIETLCDKNGDITIQTVDSENPKNKGKKGKSIDISLLNESGHGVTANLNTKDNEISTLSINHIHNDNNSTSFTNSESLLEVEKDFNGSVSKLTLDPDKLELIDEKEGIKININRTTKKITIDTNNDSQIILSKDSKKVEIKADVIEVGDALLEYIVKATKLRDWIKDEINSIFNDHVHVGNLGYNTSSPTTNMSDPSESDIASEKHKVE